MLLLSLVKHHVTCDKKTPIMKRKHRYGKCFILDYNYETLLISHCYFPLLRKESYTLLYICMLSWIYKSKCAVTVSLYINMNVVYKNIFMLPDVCKHIRRIWVFKVHMWKYMNKKSMYVALYKGRLNLNIHYPGNLKMYLLI